MLDDKQVLLKDEERQADKALRDAVDNTLRDSLSRVERGEARSAMSMHSAAASTAHSTGASVPQGAPNFISAVIPLFGMIALSTLSAFFLGRWSFSILWTLFIVYGVWEVVRRRVERFEAYHRNRIDREIAKEKLEYHMETCEWINHIVDRFWAVLEPVVSSQVIDKTNQELARQCPGFLDSLELTEFTLGSSAPHILGARVYPQTGSDVIHLDMDVCFVPNEIVEHDFIPKTTRGPSRWNSKIVLNARVGKGMVSMDIPVLIREILFYGRFRAQIQLAANIPFIQKVEFGFLEQPKIDFILKPLKSVDIMDLPGLSRFLFSMINTNVSKMLVDPNKITIDVAELMKDKKKTRMNSIGVVRVKVLQTRGLKDPEDSSVQMSIAGRLKAETMKLDKDGDGWNEVHYLLIPSLSYPITFNVNGPSSLGLVSSSTELLGTCKVNIEDVAQAEKPENYLNFWKQLTTRSTSKSTPELNLGVEYFAAEYMDDEGDAKQAPKPVGDTAKVTTDLPKFKSGILQITLHGAKDLPSHPAKKDWTTFVEASIKNCLGEDAAKKHLDDDINPYRFRSTIKKKTNAPSWEETFEFLVVDYERDEVLLRLRDAKDDLPLGNLSLKAKQLLDKSDWFPLNGVESGKMYLSTVFKPINIHIDDPSGLKHAPAIGVLSVLIMNGEGFKKRNELQGKQEYYLDLSLNGRLVKRTRAVKTMENPEWKEKASVMVKADTDQIVMKLFEENSLMKDSGEGSITVPLRQAIADPSKTLQYSIALKAKKSPEDAEGEKIRFQITYYPIGTLTNTAKEGVKEGTMVELGTIEEPSNSGVLELRTVSLVGFNDKVAGKMKISCQMGISTLPQELNSTKTARAQGIDNRFTWELFNEFFVADYSKTSLWLVFTDESGLMADSRVASVSVPVALLQSNKSIQIPNMPALSVTVEGQYRGVSVKLAAPIERSGLLRMDIIRATVIAADSGGTSDPFVTVKLNNKTIFKTKVIKKTVTPEWKESCQVNLEDRMTSKLQFEVSDWNQVMMAESLGKVDIDLPQLVADRDCPMECKLQGVPTGTLWLNLHFETFSGKSAAGKITTVPVLKERSEGLVGAASDMTKGAAGAVTGVTGAMAGAAGSMAGHTAGATKAMAHGTASAVKSVGSVFGLTSSKPSKSSTPSSGGEHIESDLKFTISMMTASPEIQAFDASIAAFLDGKDRLFKTRMVKSNKTPEWKESFEVPLKQLKHARAIEFVPESNIPLEALKLGPNDRPVFRLDLGRAELMAEEGAEFKLCLNDREDDPPLTLHVHVQPIAQRAPSATGLGKMFNKVKFGR